MTDCGSSLIICLGANLTSVAGAPAETLRSAIAEMTSIGVQVTAVSRFFATPCFPAGNGPDYVNAAISARSRQAPQDILAGLHRLETAYGRNRDTRWGQRTLDLDLTTCGQTVLPDRDCFQKWHALPADEQRLAAPDRLVLPHPRIQDRAFVLVPMADIAPNWVHPVLGLSVLQMKDALPTADLAEVRPL